MTEAKPLELQFLPATPEKKIRCSFCTDPRPCEWKLPIKVDGKIVAPGIHEGCWDAVADKYGEKKP